MAVACVDKKTGSRQDHSNGATSCTISGLTVSGADPYILVTARRSAAVSITNVQYNGANLGSAWNDTSGGTCIWGGVPQSSGSNDLVITYPNDGDFVAEVHTFSGVDSATPYVNPISTSSASTQYPSVSVDSPPANGLAWVALYIAAFDSTTLTISNLDNAQQHYLPNGGNTMSTGTRGSAGTPSWGNLGLVRGCYFAVVYLNPTADISLPTRPLIVSDAVHRASNW